MFRKPIAIEYRVVDTSNKLRGAIDRIDLITHKPVDITLPVTTDEQWDAAGDYISKSRCTLFDFCPLKYKKQYIDKSLPRESNKVMSIGTRFHEFAETFINIRESYPVDTWKDFVHPDFIDEERDMLEWFIDFETERYLNNNDNFKYNTIEVIEYKTSAKIKKPQLQFEFGFYDILVDAIEELKDYDRVFTVIYPRLKTVVSFNPSRRTTIHKKLNNIRSAIDTMKFLPKCDGIEYATPFCDICTLEEIDSERSNYYNQGEITYDVIY